MWMCYILYEVLELIAVLLLIVNNFGVVLNHDLVTRKLLFLFIFLPVGFRFF